MLRLSVSTFILALAGCANAVSTPSPRTNAGLAYDLRANPKPIGVQSINARPGPDVRFFVGIDAVLLAPNAGLRTATRVSMATVRIVAGGRLGDDKVLAPGAAAGKFVVFLPPLDENGDVIYRPLHWATHLAPYATARAIGVVSLDETPRGLADALTVGDVIEDRLIGGKLPPVIIFSRGPALVLFDDAGYANDFPSAGVTGLYFSANARWIPRR